MSNWAQQAKTHVHESKALRVAVYHGAGKMTAEELRSYDIVVTSYGTLSSDRDRKGHLFCSSWHRVILDEGHCIRNARTKAAVAACELKAESRWILTGTPIVNSIKDLHSMVKFLKLTGGIENAEVFNTVITRPLAQGKHSAEVLLQSLMQNLCLRRRKDVGSMVLLLRLPTLHPGESSRHPCFGLRDILTRRNRWPLLNWGYRRRVNMFTESRSIPRRKRSTRLCCKYCSVVPFLEHFCASEMDH